MEPQITEKAFYKMLISSVLGILLCMTCLVSATWAWFTVELNNTGNIIQIAEPEIRVQLDGTDFSSGWAVSAGSHRLSITHSGSADDFQQKSTLYVTITLDGTQTYYAVLNGSNQYAREILLELDRSCGITYDVSWFAPDNATPLAAEQPIQGAEQPAETEPTT